MTPSHCRWSIVAVFFAALAVPPAPAQELARDIQARVMGVTAFVQGKQGHGSGFVVLPGVFATNAHVVRDELIDDVRVKFIDQEGNEKKYPVKLLSIDKARDLALLWAKDLPTSYKPLTVASKVEIGGRPRVFVVGNPAQAEAGISLINSIGQGNLGSELVMMDGKPFYQLTVMTARDKIKVGPGNSGGPVVNAKGEVVGVLTAGMVDPRTRKPTEKMFTIPASAVQAAMTDVGEAAKWDTVAAKAAERHAVDLTARSLYANVLIAETVLKARKDVWDNAVRGYGYFTYINGNPVQEDAGLIDLFNKCDKAVREKTKLTLKTALDGNQLPLEQKKNLRLLINRLDSIRPIVTGKRATVQQAKKCEEMFVECDRAFDKVAAETGWTKADAVLVEVGILLEAGVKLAEPRN